MPNNANTDLEDSSLRVVPKASGILSLMRQSLGNMVNKYKYNSGNLMAGNQSVITEEYEYELQPKGWKLQKLPIYGEDFIIKNIDNAFKPSPSKKKVTLLVPDIEKGSREATPKAITPDEYPTFIRAITSTKQ
mmetsp:Transcript_15359/g.23651  ORF Transcript_15359/g.23651 Transcript_15359/m.23651 type:complete len:133 (+) Transcript_15359:1138-1536(+)|eukprot:CAMPEP_0170512236 /NCGR_PEP_ID=MMETSP0208-20121228/66740_1 /TAXON_ID=197538 /ORGANISM="Strombidium inclinatum, Strain S3" /LENGTH=132 /DNA_ID=CAMNT_0010795849 /DNA_START=1680 /DNA_END=2078 /DNA_ORIENTATION=+